MGKLTNAGIKAIKPTGEHRLYGDGDTLYLSVAPGGSKSWVQRVAINGRRRDIGLGGWPVVTLAEARDAALDNRRTIRRGGDPLAEKRKSKAPTFAEAAAAVFQIKAPTLSSEKSRREWLVSTERYAFPIIGGTRLNMIGREDVLQILTPIWTAKPETARRLRQRMKAVFAWGMAHGHCENNPAGEAINGALPAMPAVKKHNTALPHVEIAAVLEAVDGTKASPAVRGALRFLILTACRPGEVRGARWDEIEREAGVWKIPASRMKARREHRVPITPAMVAVLDMMEEHRDDSGLIFPSPTNHGASLSAAGLVKALTEAGYPRNRTTLHGFRSSFRDWCGDTGKPREIAEAALAHTVGGVEGAYFRSDLMDRRRDLMAAWADHATGAAPGKVVALRA